MLKTQFWFFRPVKSWSSRIADLVEAWLWLITEEIGANSIGYKRLLENPTLMFSTECLCFEVVGSLNLPLSCFFYQIVIGLKRAVALVFLFLGRSVAFMWAGALTSYVHWLKLSTMWRALIFNTESLMLPLWKSVLRSSSLRSWGL